MSNPITREETFLAAAAGDSVTLPKPITRVEQYLKRIAERTGTGGGSPDSPQNGNDVWEILCDVTFTEAVNFFAVTTDIDGNTFEARELMVYLLMSKVETTDYLRMGINPIFQNEMLHSAESAYGVPQAGATNNIFELISHFVLTNNGSVLLTNGMTRTNAYNAFADIRINGNITPKSLSTGKIKGFCFMNGVTLNPDTKLQIFIKR